jgi:hypothetical protein
VIGKLVWISMLCDNVMILVKIRSNLIRNSKRILALVILKAGSL